MSKILGIIIVAILFVTGAYFIFGQSSDSTTDTFSPDEKMAGSESFSGTMMDLLKLGQDYECSFSVSGTEGDETGGIVYVASGGDKMYGEFSASMGDEGDYQSFVIKDGTYNYVWSSMQTQGMKMLIEEEDNDFIASGEEGEVDYGVDYDQNYSYKCKAWSVDDDIFVPPNDIEFVDFSTMVSDMTESFGDIDVDCSVCDQVPEGDVKVQCLSALGC